MDDTAAEADEFVGFNKARSIMWCYEVRSRTFLRLSETDFVADTTVSSVHVNNTARTDRIFLSAFDKHGRRVGSETLFVDDPAQQVDITPEFDHDFTSMAVQSDSQLAEAVDRGNGWVINMDALRAYDLDADRSATQLQIFMTHLPDLMAAGHVRTFAIGSTSPAGAGDENPGAGMNPDAA